MLASMAKSFGRAGAGVRPKTPRGGMMIAYASVLARVRLTRVPGKVA